MTNYQSRFVLGGSSLAGLPAERLNELLDVAFSLGINEIDSAPSYGNLEPSLGRILSGDSKWVINSKLGNQSHTSFPLEGVSAQIQNTMNNLRRDSLGTLFVHSIPLKNVANGEIESLSELKNEKLVKHIGFASNTDVDDLALATQSTIFDSFQITANILDQSNLKMFSRVSESNVYFKRVLGSGVLKTGYLDDLKLQTKKIFQMNDRFDTNDYLFRFNEMFGFYRRKSDFLREFLRFVLSLGQQHRIIIGVSNPNNLRELARFETEIKSMDDFEISNYAWLFDELDKVNRWKPFR
jgi:aryl-alcohol dehydrogenase-like predicted oxidoreductase